MPIPSKPKSSRRRFLHRSATSAFAASTIAALPLAGCAGRRLFRDRLALEFLTIPDPDGWHPSLRLKGDWLIFKISDGVHSGYGEASHSKADAKCRTTAARLFQQRLSAFNPSLERLRNLEAELSGTAPDFVTATAWSGLNQALYDLLAKREQVPVWRLFRDRPGFEKLALYTTINRALKTRSATEYLELVGDAQSRGFKAFKCAPFEKVTGPENALANSRAGLNTLRLLRERFPELAIRVDFHERFSPADFFQLLPELEKLRLDWIEEPFHMGSEYAELKRRTHLRVAAGELFWGRGKFRAIMENQWADVIMPDVKHVGGFGPLLDVLKMGGGRIEVSPHNPSGPVSTAASMHAGMLYPETVKSLEFAFDGPRVRRNYGEIVEHGFLHASPKPGWGIEVEKSVRTRKLP